MNICSDNVCFYEYNPLTQPFFSHILLKKIIFPVNFVLKFLFLGNTNKFVMKKKLQEIAVNFLKSILYKILFTTNFERNTYEFYNFVGNNYP